MGRDKYGNCSCSSNSNCNICGCNPCRCNKSNYGSCNNMNYGNCDNTNSSGHSYATFCTENLEQHVYRGEEVRFDKGSNCIEGIKLVRGGRRGRDRHIEVCEAGVYYISYMVHNEIIGIADYDGSINNQMCIYVNDLIQDCSRGGSLVPNPGPDNKLCTTITGSLVLCLSACSAITLRNCSPDGPGDHIHLCTDLGIEANISIFKIC